MYHPFIRMRFGNARQLGEYGQQYDLARRAFDSLRGGVLGVEVETAELLVDVESWLLWRLPYAFAVELIPQPQTMTRNKRHISTSLKAKGLPAFAHYDEILYHSTPRVLSEGRKLWSRFYHAQEATKRYGKLLPAVTQYGLSAHLKEYPHELGLLMHEAPLDNLVAGLLALESACLLMFATTYYENACLGTLTRTV